MDRTDDSLGKSKRPFKEIKKEFSSLRCWIAGSYVAGLLLFIVFIVIYAQYEKLQWEHTLNGHLERSQKVLDSIDTTMMSKESMDAKHKSEP
ncbi:MAG: hypothetical protein LBQ51_05560 [Desulfovibrio sp.]|jgi:hypothetical protein|nr:hypothetical protein [Desulfovibrio sp.]